jgi:hypothetical protein
MVSCYKKIAAYESEIRFDPSIPDFAIPHAIVSVNELFKLFFTIYYTVIIKQQSRVKSMGLTINSRFAWDDQTNIVCRRVYFTLKRMWTTVSLTTQLQLALGAVLCAYVSLHIILYALQVFFFE